MNDNKLNLDEAAAKLSKLTTDSISPVSIIRAGAAGKLPVHWFNDLHRTTYISDFTGDLSGTDSDGPLQLTRTSLGELAVADSVTVFDFALTDKDFALLEEIKVRKPKLKTVDDDENLLVHRHPATKDGIVNISRDQLFVYEGDLQKYAATLTTDPAPDPKPPATGVGQGPSTPETPAARVVHEVAASGDEWKDKARARAREIIKQRKAQDLYPDQLAIADEIAKEFRTDGIVGADGKPLTGSTIKRHALKGISSAKDKQL